MKAAGIALLVVLAVAGVFVLVKSKQAPAPGAYSIQQIGGGGGSQPVNSLTAATTTPCAIFVSATSSLLHFAFKVTTGTSSAGVIVVGTSTTAFSTTTTPFATFTVGGGAQITQTWNAGVNNDVVSPGTWIVAGMAASSAVGYGYTYGGTCSALIVAD